MGDTGMPEARCREAVLAATSTRRTLDENVAAAAEVAYAAGRADEQARISADLRAEYSRRMPDAQPWLREYANRCERGEHLDA